MNRAVFLDRDGTLNPDPGYIADPALFELFPGVGAALAALKKSGFLLVLITNQSGLSRGLISEEQLQAVHKKMNALLAGFDVSLDGIYYCPHHPDHPYMDGLAECDCRKPQPGMIIKACRELDIDPSASFMVGDRSSDVKIALASGVQPVFIGNAPLEKYVHVPTFSSLAAAADWIVSRS
jgi:D,D-heptose 1,7-bisphosphate phosphatase